MSDLAGALVVVALAVAIGLQLVRLGRLVREWTGLRRRCRSELQACRSRWSEARRLAAEQASARVEP